MPDAEPARVQLTITLSADDRAALDARARLVTRERGVLTRPATLAALLLHEALAARAREPGADVAGSAVLTRE